MTVSKNAQGLQFFIVKDGFEGFLQKDYKGVNADNTTFKGPNGRTRRGSDVNDAMVVFDKKGELVYSGQLITPVELNNGKTPKAIKSMDKGSVSFYSHPNTDWGNYRATTVDYKGKQDYWVDVHTFIGTHGCVELSPLNTKGEKTLESGYGGEPSNYKSFMDTYFKPNPSRGEKKLNVGTMRTVGYE